MNLSTFNSKLKIIPLRRSFVITLSLLTSYHLLVLTKLVPPSNGINQWQTNVIKIQRYAYHKSQKPNLVLVGSSLTGNLETSYIDSHTFNLGMAAGSAQTGIEAVQRNPIKPEILLIEVNGTLIRKTDKQITNSVYNPFLYYFRLYFPMFREEYQPASVFIPQFIWFRQRFTYALSKLFKLITFTNTNTKNTPTYEFNSRIAEKLIAEFIDSQNQAIPEQEKRVLIQESEFIKSQILKIQRNGVRVVLYDVPIDHRLKNTVKEKQIKALIQNIFPKNKFEWLPEPPPRNWKTYDGVHIVSSEAKDFVTFIRNQLLVKKTAMSKPMNAEPTLKHEIQMEKAGI